MDDVGQGMVAAHLAYAFDTVVGVDVSEAMISAAKSSIKAKSRKGKAIEWKVASADSMPFLKRATIDLVVAGIAGKLSTS